MEPGGSMPHSQGLSNNSYPEPNQPNTGLIYIYYNFIRFLFEYSRRVNLQMSVLPFGNNHFYSHKV